MLKLHDTERSLLEAASAIALDDSGEEILAGLDGAESDFVLSVERRGKDDLSGVDRQRYLTLMIRHRAARIMVAARKVLPKE